MIRDTVIRILLHPDKGDLGGESNSTFYCEKPMIRFTDTHLQVLGVDVNIVYLRERVKAFEASTL